MKFWENLEEMPTYKAPISKLYVCNVSVNEDSRTAQKIICVNICSYGVDSYIDVSTGDEYYSDGLLKPKCEYDDENTLSGKSVKWIKSRGYYASYFDEDLKFLGLGWDDEISLYILKKQAKQLQEDFLESKKNRSEYFGHGIHRIL